VTSSAEWDLDVLEGGRDPGRSPWVARAVVAVVVGVALVVTAVPWLARHRAQQEYDALARCVSVGQSAVVYADAALAGMEQYIGHGLSSANTPDLRRSLLSLLSSSAATAEPSLQQALRSCKGVHIAGSHRATANARAAYVSYLQAEADFYAAVAADARAARFTPPEHALLLAEARRALFAASPTPKARAEIDDTLGAA
jgi:hypothetical protein